MHSDTGDSILSVRFYEKEVEMPFQTEQEGRPIFKMMDWIRIEIPGNRLNIIDTIAETGHKKRFPLQWAQYQNDKNSDQFEGTPIKEWALMTSSQALELRHYKFYTVEQVAAASDQQLSGIGSIVGMAGSAFREKARAYIANAKSSAFATSQVDELAKRDREIADLKAQMERLAMQMNARRGGRPPKERPTPEFEHEQSEIISS